MALVAALGRRRMSDGERDEAELVRRLARGDTAVVDALYARFGRPLYAYVRSLVGDESLAEEVVQDTFVAAWRGAGRFEGRSSLASWLFGIARRQTRDRTRRAVPDTEPVDRLAEVPGGDPGPEAAVLAAATRAELAEAMQRIPAADREVLLLAFAYELSGPEIADVLAIPAGTVKSRLFNARRRMREQLLEKEPR